MSRIELNVMFRKYTTQYTLSTVHMQYNTTTKQKYLGHSPYCIYYLLTPTLTQPVGLVCCMCM